MKLKAIEIGGNDTILFRLDHVLITTDAVWDAVKKDTKIKFGDYSVVRHELSNSTSIIFNDAVGAIKSILADVEQFKNMPPERFLQHRFTIYKEAANRFLKILRDYINTVNKDLACAPVLAAECHALYLRDKGWRYLIDEFTGRFMVTPRNNESMEYIGQFIDSLDNLERVHYKYQQENPRV